MTPMTSTTSPDDIFNEEDYPIESSTHHDWEDQLPTATSNSLLANEKQSV